MSSLNARIKIRRDNDYNYDAHPDFIPLLGEVCIVDTSTEGVKFKIGDGSTKYQFLDYIKTGSDYLVFGYYYADAFYKDAEHTEVIPALQNRLYIDVITFQVFCFDGLTYVPIIGDIPKASDQTPGVLKLYNETGDNTDGTMTQRSITNELDNLKFDVDGETLVASYIINY